MDPCGKRACQIMAQRESIIERLFSDLKPLTNAERKALDHYSRQLEWLRTYQIKMRQAYEYEGKKRAIIESSKTQR